MAWGLGAGLLCAAAALTRPAAIGLAVPIALELLLYRQEPQQRRRAAAVRVVAGFLGGVAP